MMNRQQLNKTACDYNKHSEIKNYSNGHAWKKYLKGKNRVLGKFCNMA
jgi:hypothetical protein